MNEKLVERKLREKVKRLGGVALKLWSITDNGLPDRIVLMPSGRIWFVELKTTNEKLKPMQKIKFNMLISLGFYVCVVDTQEALDNFLILIAS